MTTALLVCNSSASIESVLEATRPRTNWAQPWLEVRRLRRSVAFKQTLNAARRHGWPTFHYCNHR